MSSQEAMRDDVTIMSWEPVLSYVVVIVVIVIIVHSFSEDTLQRHV